MITLANAFGGPNYSPATVGGTGTTSKIYAQSNSAATPFVLYAPNGGQLEGAKFVVRAGGNVFVHGTTPTVIVSLYGKTSIPASGPLTATNYTEIGQTGSAQTLTTAATYPWVIEAELQGDSVSGVLQGTYKVLVNNVFKAEAALDNTITSVNLNPTTGGVSLVFVVGVTFGVSDALNTATLDQFTLEA